MFSIHWQSIFIVLILGLQIIILAGLWFVVQRRSVAFKPSALTPTAHKEIIDRLDAAAIILDLQGVVVELNPAAAKLCSTNDQLAQGKPLTESIPWWVDIEKRFDHCIELQEDIQVSVSGKKRYLNLQITPIWDSRQKLTGRLLLIRDVTTEKATQGALSLASVRAEFLAKVSHELRTPLTSILGVTEMLDYGVYGPISREQKEALRLIADSSQHMVRLVNDLLEQTRLERGGLQLDIAEFVMVDLINRLRVNTIQAARSKGLNLTLEIAPDVPTILCGDALRIYQILRNLVDNAVKYTEKGWVKVRVFRCGQDQYAFEVSDTGIGIPKDKQSLIYEPFLRVYPAQRGNGNGNGHKNGNGNGHVEGFGLGLSIVKQLITLMDGQIELESEGGRGTTFTVKLHLEPVDMTILDPS